MILRCFLIVGTFVLFSYISPPQLNVDLLPFFALIPLVPLPLFYTFEAANLASYAFPNSVLPGANQIFDLIRQASLAVILVLIVANRALKGAKLSDFSRNGSQENSKDISYQ